jgi:hypothetical protein
MRYTMGGLIVGLMMAMFIGGGSKSSGKSKKK